MNRPSGDCSNAADNLSELLLEHAWRYFELHANQRMSVFNFYVLMSGAIATGIAAVLQGSPKLAAVGIFLGLLMPLLAFVFWKLDQRVSFLIKHAESALGEVEKSLPLECARLFNQEPGSTSFERARMGFWQRQWSYSEAFRFIFVATAIFGVAATILSALKFAGVVVW